MSALSCTARPDSVIRCLNSLASKVSVVTYKNYRGQRWTLSVGVFDYSVVRTTPCTFAMRAQACRVAMTDSDAPAVIETGLDWTEMSKFLNGLIQELADDQENADDEAFAVHSIGNPNPKSFDGSWLEEQMERWACRNL